MAEQQRFFTVPFWIESAMTRNGMQLGDVLDYNKLRSVISLNDAAELLALQNLQTFTFQKLIPNTGLLLSSWQESAQGAYLTELDSVMPLLSCGDSLNAGLIERLSNGDPSSIEAVSSKYKISSCRRDVHCIVLDKGFIDAQATVGFNLEFCRSLIESVKIYLNTQEVASFPFFNIYVRELSQLNLVTE